VRFLGRLPHAQTVAEIARSHVLILPSRFLESYGLVLIEALIQGTNVLAANRGAVGEIIADTGVGHLYQLDDAASLREQWQQIEQQHADGTLNQFDLTPFLLQRSETRYVERLLDAYAGGSAAVPKAA
jgi:glycosyltransferase involved in cell wall biosynthesis